MSTPSLDPRLLQLDPQDNVCVCVQTLEAGDQIMIQNKSYVVPQKLTLGHKIALREILKGEKILKFKAPIGSAKESIPVGCWIHLHNMQSDYLPTYTREDQQKFYEKH